MTKTGTRVILDSMSCELGQCDRRADVSGRRFGLDKQICRSHYQRLLQWERQGYEPSKEQVEARIGKRGVRPGAACRYCVSGTPAKVGGLCSTHDSRMREGWTEEQMRQPIGSGRRPPVFAGRGLELRDKMVCVMVRMGYTYEKVGDFFDLSRQRVEQIFNRE